MELKWSSLLEALLNPKNPWLQWRDGILYLHVDTENQEQLRRTLEGLKTQGFLKSLRLIPAGRERARFRFLLRGAVVGDPGAPTHFVNTIGPLIEGWALVDT